MTRMVIADSVREAGTDPIFRIAGEAAKRTAELGADAVINSTIGALMEDDGSLVCFESVFGTLKNLPDAEISNYAGIAGIPEFLDKVVDACFKSQRPEGHIRAVATPGGTGAVRNAVCNYTEFHDEILIPDWYWAPYSTIADENRRSTVTFELFDEEGHFNMASYQSKFLELLKKQNRVLSILNTPAHNPTGYSISLDEWKELVAFYTETALANPEARIIILCDIAYIDFAGQGDSAREFMPLLANMPENVLPLYAYSASKGYTMYGLRNGAILCVAPTEEIADEFFAACSYSNRGTWSNGTRGAMKTLAEIQTIPELREKFDAEQKSYREILQRRAAAFLEEAEKVGLEMCPYKDGFFISIPCEDAKAVSDLLMEKNVFVVALAKGLRFAPCAVSEEKCRRSPALIAEAIAAWKAQNK